VSSKKADQLYSDEISLLTPKELEDYVLLNLRKIHNYRRNFNIPVIGIAGLEGKTTIVKMLSAILSSKHKVLETPPNCSTTYGVTSTLLKLDQSHEFAIIEVGIVEPVQFERAVQVLEPTIAAITNIGESHLATYGDKYLIADAKLEMLRRLPRDGYAVLNIDDDLVSAMAKFSGTSNVIKFGLNKNAQFYASKIEYLGPDGIIFYVNGFYPFHLPIYSSAAIYNALTAISIARILGVEFSEIKEALETRFRLLEGTGNLIKHKKNYVLDYTYDATINSVHKACESLVQFNPYSKKLILVIGDIRNPGPKAKEAHLKIGYYIAALPIHTVLTIGENAEYIGEGIRQINQTKKQIDSFKDSEELIKKLPEYLDYQSTLLFTGSKKLKLKKTLNQALPLLK
jgi:UDP-N-acetylmuramoyl-tripeptide--D-alanyl-D-alanine ligase